MTARAATLEDLVQRWTYGWALSRRLHTSRVDGADRIDVNDTSRRVEYVMANPDDRQFAQLAADITGRSDAWLTVFAPDIERYCLLAASLDVAADDEVFMSCRLETVGAADQSFIDSDQVLIDSDGMRFDARLEISGRLAAVGSVAVNGLDAVFDRVETMPQFRRQGHGSTMMQALATAAHGRGARHGLLAASAGGQQLYRRLGWTPASAMISFTGRRPPNAPSGAEMADSPAFSAVPAPVGIRPAPLGGQTVGGYAGHE